MINWYEPLPGFWLPRTWTYDRAIWPDYTDPNYVRALEEAPDVGAMMVMRGIGEPARHAWGAWFGAFGADKPLKRGWQDLEMIAGKMYDTARYKFLVPAWKRAITNIVTELDDLEDQLSTILWVAETVSRKWIPLPKGLLNTAERVNTAVDCAGKAVAGIGYGRGAKSEYVECLSAKRRAKEIKRKQKAGLIAWFQENWGRLLEAAQATGTWFDVGIVLGPIYGWIDEGLWGATKATAENYLLATDALFPGYAKWARETDDEINRAVEQAWDDTWGSADMGDFDPWTITEDHPGFWAP